MTRQSPRPVTEEDYKAVRKLAAKGKGRNEIAREIGRSSRTVSEIAAKLDPPITFDRTATAVATEARKIDAKARRAAIIERTYARIEKLHDRLDAADSGNYKFTTNTVNGIETQRLDHVPAQDEKALAGAITQYLGQAVKLEQLDGDPGVEAARSMLSTLAEGLNKLAGLDAGEDDSGEG
ncbi:helix-turn-helix domain-containing protein [Streptomyces hygroscopicus]|uniref:helix-turn-helix domain-containing protein n=1 Tax=Streptomyces hygroscopicus TaxID=1912 RepID=UPI003674C098